MEPVLCQQRQRDGETEDHARSEKSDNTAVDVRSHVGKVKWLSPAPGERQEYCPVMEQGTLDRIYLDCFRQDKVEKSRERSVQWCFKYGMHVL